MTKLFRTLKYSSLILLFVFIACEKDYNVIESKVLSEDNVNFNASESGIKILAYNKKLNSLQINNLGSSLLGFYNDPLYGQTTASFITQVTPATYSPDFGNNVVLDSVILNIPYYGRATGEVNANNVPKYTLNDSVFGNENAPIKLTIYRNNYFLRDLTLQSNGSQNFYSNASNPDKANNYAVTENATINFDSQKGEILYESDALNGFTPSPKAIVLVTTASDGSIAKTASKPAFRINLADDTSKKAYWSSLIIEKQNDLVLSNSNNFKNYFRGLYFKAEAINSDGQMILLNTNSPEAIITMYYTSDKEDTTPIIREQGTYVLTLTGNRVNPFINTFTPNLQDGDLDLGDEKLFLKGAEGSMAVVDLFNDLVKVNCEETNTEEYALDCFKKTYRKLNENGYILKSGEKVLNGYIVKNGNFVLKRIINEAHLIIYEDETAINTQELKDQHTYDRIYAFDIENNLPTFDYLIDGTENLSDPKNSNFISLGQRLTDNSGVSKYKIRLTEHLNKILVNDSTNTKLGLVLSNNVNMIRNSDLLENNDMVTAVPTASILSPRGTVLHGSQSSTLEKRMRLDIYLTEVKE